MPVTQQRHVRSPEGAMYGIEITAERLTRPALHVSTPLSGLLLARQDGHQPGSANGLHGRPDSRGGD